MLPGSMADIESMMSEAVSNEDDEMEALAQFMQDAELMKLISGHSTGRFTARRIYQLATEPEDRRYMERVDSSMLEPVSVLSKFDVSLIPADLIMPEP